MSGSQGRGIRAWVVLLLGDAADQGIHLSILELSGVLTYYLASTCARAFAAARDGRMCGWPFPKVTRELAAKAEEAASGHGSYDGLIEDAEQRVMAQRAMGWSEAMGI